MIYNNFVVFMTTGKLPLAYLALREVSQMAKDLHMHQKLAFEAYLLLSELLWGRRSLIPIQKWRAERKGPHELGHKDQAVVTLMSHLGGQSPGDIFQVELFGSMGYCNCVVVTMVKVPPFGTFKGVIHFGYEGWSMSYSGCMFWTYDGGLNEQPMPIRPDGKVKVLRDVELPVSAEQHVKRVDFISSDD